MKILFFARHFTYLRNFESALRLLAEQGHQVHVAVERDEAFGGREMMDRLSNEYPGLTAGWSPERTDRWFFLATKLRLTIDYLRFMEPAYDLTPRLRARAKERVPQLLLRFLGLPLIRSTHGRRYLTRVLASLEQAIPLDPSILKFIREHHPDAVLITPLVGVVASPQLDYLYASLHLGVPTALSVWSWDHLSSKALIRTIPDRVLVWNHTQEREAVELHGVPRERVVVTGAQCFDQWFNRKPSRTRTSFYEHVGLRDDRPFLLWVCSSLFRGSPVEAEFVIRWIRNLRSHSESMLRNVNVLVRPHPSRMQEWESTDLSELEGVTLWGGNPVDIESRADYFDSLYYSAAVVGLNTSAFLEGAVVGRPVYTVLLPEFHENQEGTIHFNYLLTVGNGLLHASRTLEAHTAQLAECLRRREPTSVLSQDFVELFVRPQGLSVSSTQVFVEALESLSVLKPVPVAVPVTWSRRVSLTAFAWFANGIGRTVMMSRRERDQSTRVQAVRELKRADREIRLARKQEIRAAKAVRYAKRLKEKQRRSSRRRHRWLGLYPWGSRH